jgi:hypothetical protein
MRKQTIFLTVFLFNLSSFMLYGQEPGESSFSEEKWTSIKHKWIRSQPAIIVYTDSSGLYSGLPIHAARDTLYLFPDTDFPIGVDWNSEILAIPFMDINHVLLQRGGNSLTRANRSDSIVVPQSDKFYTPQFQAIRNASVYPDSMVNPISLEEAFPYSKVMREVFPRKHLRISFGPGFGALGAAEDAQMALLNSSLPEPFFYEDRVSLDLLDVSWRFWEHYIVGGQLSARIFSKSLGGYYYEQEALDINYDYQIKFSENRLYVEYVFFPVNRFFTHRFELMAGAGFLVGKPEWSMYYNYNDNTDPDIWISDEVRYELKNNIFGFQLRTAFHFYLFPGASLWAGMEANLYKPWIIETHELPTPDTNAPIVLEKHSLDFSGFRIKFGFSIYL